MAEPTRRRLLGSAAGALGGAAALSLLPPSVRKAVAAGPPRRGSLADVEHVVLLMQENRSFDHYFGTLSGVRGFADPDALTLDTGRSVFHTSALRFLERLTGVEAVAALPAHTLPGGTQTLPQQEPGSRPRV